MERDRHGQLLIDHSCAMCGLIRKVRKSSVARHEVCKSCAAKRRDAKYMQQNGRGRMWRGSKHFSGKIITSWKVGAAQRSLDWELSDEDLDNLWDYQEGICAFTGQVMSMNQGDANKVSLDRKDSDKGYYLGNIQFVCAYVNICKQSLTDEQFIEMCSLIVDYRS